MMAIFFIGRLGLFIWQYDRFAKEESNAILSFLYGLKIDTMMGSSILLVIPLLSLSFYAKKFSKSY